MFGDPRAGVERALREIKAQLKMSPLGYYALLAHSLKARLTDRPFKWKNPLKKHRQTHWRLAAPALPKSSIKKLKRNRYTRQLSDEISEAFGLVYPWRRRASAGKVSSDL